MLMQRKKTTTCSVVNSDILTLSFFFLLSPILEEVSKPQAAGKAVEAVEAEKTESAEAKTEAAQSS
jgi:hypothetical protein